MARRVALIPEELVSTYHLQKPEIRVEDDIVNLLDQGQLTDDMKVKLLSQLITRYHKIVSEPSEPVRVSIAEEERGKILDTQEKEKDAEKQIVTDRILQDILISVPKNFTKYVPLIVEKLNARGYGWNEAGEMLKNDIPLKNIRIVDFFLYLFRNVRAQPELRVFQVYLDVIREINIPRGWIGNKMLLKILNFNDASPSTSSTPRKDQQSPVRGSGKRHRSVSPQSRSIYETPIKWGAKTIIPKEWKTY